MFLSLRMGHGSLQMRHGDGLSLAPAVVGGRVSKKVRA